MKMFWLWPRFRMRTLFMFVAFFCATIALIVRPMAIARQQRGAVAAIEASGGIVFYDYQVERGERAHRGERPRPDDSWLTALFGLDFFYQVVRVNLILLEGDALIAASLEWLGKLPNIREIHIRLHGVETVEIAAAVGRARGIRMAKSVTILYYHQSKTSDFPPAFRHFASLANVVEFHLENGHEVVFDRACSQQLGKWPNLREVDLWGADGVNDYTLEILSGAKQLKRLELFDTQISSNGLKHIAYLPNLRILSVGDTGIDDSALSHIGKLSELRDLNLNNNIQISDAGLDHLRNLTQLQKLSLWRTSCTAEGIQRLKRFLPNLEVSSEKVKAVARPCSNNHLSLQLDEVAQTSRQLDYLQRPRYRHRFDLGPRSRS